MDPVELAELQKFAEEGGLGTCIAITDTVASTEDDLMFFEGDVITVLRHIKDDIHLGSCEGVIGRFLGSAVSFNEPLKPLKTLTPPASPNQLSVSPLNLASPKSPTFPPSPNSLEVANSQARSPTTSSPREFSPRRGDVHHHNQQQQPQTYQKNQHLNEQNYDRDNPQLRSKTLLPPASPTTSPVYYNSIDPSASSSLATHRLEQPSPFSSHPNNSSPYNDVNVNSGFSNTVPTNFPLDQSSQRFDPRNQAIALHPNNSSLNTRDQQPYPILPNQPFQLTPPPSNPNYPIPPNITDSYFPPSQLSTSLTDQGLPSYPENNQSRPYRPVRHHTSPPLSNTFEQGQEFPQHQLGPRRHNTAHQFYNSDRNNQEFETRPTILKENPHRTSVVEIANNINIYQNPMGINMSPARNQPWPHSPPHGHDQNNQYSIKPWQNADNSRSERNPNQQRPDLRYHNDTSDVSSNNNNKFNVPSGEIQRQPINENVFGPHKDSRYDNIISANASNNSPDATRRSPTNEIDQRYYTGPGNDNIVTNPNNNLTPEAIRQSPTDKNNVPRINTNLNSSSEAVRRSPTNQSVPDQKYYANPRGDNSNNAIRRSPTDESNVPRINTNLNSPSEAVRRSPTNQSVPDQKYYTSPRGDNSNNIATNFKDNLIPEATKRSPTDESSPKHYNVPRINTNLNSPPEAVKRSPTNQSVPDQKYYTSPRSDNSNNIATNFNDNLIPETTRRSPTDENRPKNYNVPRDPRYHNTPIQDSRYNTTQDSVQPVENQPSPHGTRSDSLPQENSPPKRRTDQSPRQRTHFPPSEPVTRHHSDEDEEESLIAYSASRNKREAAEQAEQKLTDQAIPRVVINRASDVPAQGPLSANESDEITSDEETVHESQATSQVTDSMKQKHTEQVLSVDDFGFVVDVSEEEVSSGGTRVPRIVTAPGAEEKTMRTVKQYRERETKWVAILNSTDPSAARENKKIKKLVRQGIPESVRGKAWRFMAGAEKYKKPKVYDILCKREKLPIYDVIERDIHRCYPDHIQFREGSGSGQSDLHDILKAYAHYNPAVGYCQGMGRLVGMMLMQMPAEDSFWLLVATIDEYMTGYFTPTLSQLRIDSIVFEQLLMEHDPKLAQHLAENEIVPLMYMTQWFMTIFTMALPWASVLRVWDIFYFEGVKLFFRIGLAIMDCVRDHILKKCPGNSEILDFLLHLPPEMVTPDLLLDAAFKIRLRRSSIRRLAKQVKLEDDGIDVVNAHLNASISSAVAPNAKEKERRILLKKQKSSEHSKVKVGGVEFKLVGESG